MNSNEQALRNLLRQADPVAREAPPRGPEVSALRRRILTEAAGPARTRWSPLLAAAAVLALTLWMGWTLTRNAAIAPLPSAPAGPALADDAPRPVRLHFSTPGGTRVVWTLDPDFEVGEDG